VWPAPSSKFLKMARSSKSLATPVVEVDCLMVMVSTALDHGKRLDW